jgi:hypothetical protein
MKRIVLVEVMQTQTGRNLARIRQVLQVLMWESQVSYGRQDNMGSHQLSWKTKNFTKALVLQESNQKLGHSTTNTRIEINTEEGF